VVKYQQATNITKQLGKMSELQLMYSSISTFLHDVYNSWMHRPKNIFNTC